MNKNKKEIIITAILIIVLLLVVSMSMRKKHPSERKSVSTTVKIKNTVSSLSAKPVKANKNIIDSQIKRAQLPWGRDPFFLVNSKKVYNKGRNLSLKGISLGQDGRGYAFINDEIVTVGETVAGYKVIDIKRDKVLLRKGEDSFYLGMPEE